MGPRTQKRQESEEDLPENAVHPLTRSAWRDWLIANQDRAVGVWLVYYKKGTGLPRVDYDEAVEEALCVGWIDSKPRALDDARSMLYFAPRKAGTGWSRPNKERVARLLAERLMLPAGLSKVEAAKADGSWERLDAVEDLVVPADLSDALRRHGAAHTYWDAFPRSVRRGILEWIQNAKRPETRAKRVEETARLAARNERANQWRG